MTPVELTIVIVSHDSERVIARCVDSIGPALRDRILVVDNASTDGTLGVLRERGVAVIAQAVNEGFGCAANRGARTASTRHLCFLNPDCEVTPGLVPAGVRALEADPRSCVVPLFDEGAGGVVQGRRAGYTRLKLVHDTLQANYGSPAICDWLRDCQRYDDPRWAWPYGACFFVERQRFLEVGGFDVRFFMYMEDVDFGRRLYAAGGHVVTLPVAVRHAPQSGAGIDTRRRLALLNEGRVRYARAQYGAAFAGLLASLVLPSTVVRAMAGRVTPS